MLKYIIVSILFLLCSFYSICNAQNYEIECSGVGSEGTYLIKVWSYAKTQPAAVEQTKKDAVHGILFKGIVGKIGECPSQFPIVYKPELEQQNQAFFKTFFSTNGDYLLYATMIGTPETIKMKKQFKVGAVISVSKDRLREMLENKGIIKKLSDGF